MPKHEMFSDGQDEPVTSMPVNEEKKEGVDSMLSQIPDPVMDAPSC
jgi:phosphoribosylcarboxyaminoimidazole (NCAIR) mutase